MELTSGLLEARRLELESQRDQLHADLFAVDGALQQVVWDLATLAENEPEESQD